ncbi:MAG: Response regulator [Cyanobacteriota bacterium erpe_2018_sw_39hr_WHONDRS-SW48-000098_B_bin.30]|nr:Response regulator [Cyanobacteriota bacterium erpe_2018_sw_39hr_WHONDRS-SW48-000098_B_bin.30]
MASDNTMLGADLMSGLMRKLTSQIGALQSELSQIESTVASKSGLEKAVKALISDSQHLELALVPGIIMRLSKERSLGAVLTGEEGQVLLANPAFYTLTGMSGQDFENNQIAFYEPGQDGLVPVAVKPWDVPQDKRSVKAKDSVLLSGRFALSDGKDGGTVKWLQFVGKPLTDDEGHYGGCLTFVAEATEEAQLEQKIAQLLCELKGQLERLNSPVADFNRVIASALAFNQFAAPQAVLPDSYNHDLSEIEEPFFRDIEEGLDNIITGQPQTTEVLNSYNRMHVAEPDASESIDEILPEAKIPEPQITEPPLEVLEAPVAETQAEPEVASLAVESVIEAAAEPVISVEEESVTTPEEPEANEDFNPPVDDSQADMNAQAVEAVSNADNDLLVDDIEEIGAEVEKEAALWSEFSDFVREVPQVLDDSRDDEPVSVFAHHESPALTSAQEDSVPEPEPVSEPIAEPMAEPLPEPSIEAPVEEELPVWQSAVAEPEPEQSDELDQSREEQSQAQALPVLEAAPVLPVFEPVAPSPVAERRALIVDDIPVNQKLLVHQLRKLGFKTEVAANGLEALNHYHKDLTIIFMDCDMPVMNGYEATAEIRRREVELGRHVPIIAMTSYDRDADKERCISAGMDDYLTKGINEGTLSRVIETALGHEHNAAGDQVLQAQISDTMSGGETAPFDADNIAASYSREELKDIMKSFLAAMEGFVGSMQKAIDENNVEKVKQLSNSIKGPCASLGLKLMTRVASDIITYASSSDWPQVRLKYLKLKTVYLRSQADLRKACPEAFDEQAMKLNTV